MNDSIINLEIKLAYQENKIDELNTVIIDQQKEIDTINKQLEKLEGIILKLTDNDPTGNLKDSSYLSAPHYSKR